MIHGNFDFCFATGGNGADGADAAATGDGAWGVTTSPVVRCCCCSTRGGGGGAGVGGGVGGLEISEVLGADPVVVGPVLRGNATVAG